MNKLKPLISLTISAIRRYMRDLTGLFFSLAIPLFLIAIFGFLSGSSGGARFTLGVLDQANNESSKSLINTLYCNNPTECDKKNKDQTKNSAFEITEKSEEELKTLLRKGDLSGVLIIPSNFDPQNISQLTFLKNEGKTQNTGTMSLILNQITDNLFNINPQTKKVSINAENFESKNLTIIDFLIPGILGLNVMSIGIFGVAFAFVTQKTNGTLKRLLAAPIRGSDIILSEGISRTIIAFIQVLIFLGVGIIMFDLKIQGSIWVVFLISLLGIIIFLAMGFAIAGYSKDENQVAPLSQLVNLPMTFLSGAFFTRDIFPDWLKTITDFLPLTYFTDGLREVMNNGASIFDIRGQILGLLVWCVISILIAFKVFRWQ